MFSCRVDITHLQRNHEAMSGANESCFPPDRLPARTCIGVTGLARDALVEIDMAARRP